MLTAKKKQSSIGAAALTFVGVVSDAELDAFVRTALGVELLSNPLAMRVSTQTRLKFCMFKWTLVLTVRII